MTVKVSEIIQTCRNLAKEFPEARYPVTESCCYTQGEAGPGQGCLIGQAIVRVYPELLPKLKRIDKAGGATVASMLLTLKVEPSEIVEQAVAEVHWLSRLQHKQDCGYPWSECLKEADSIAVANKWEIMTGHLVPTGEVYQFTDLESAGDALAALDATNEDTNDVAVED